MPVKLIGREYNNQFYGAPSSVDWLLGNVGDWQKCRVTFEGRVEFIASNSEPVTLDLKNDTITLSNGKTWASYGFDLGDTVLFSFRYDGDGNGTGILFNVSLVINNLYGSVMEHDTDLSVVPFLSQYSQIPLNIGTSAIFEVEFKSAKEPEGIKFRYSHLTNDDFDSNVVISFIDQSQTEFSYAGLDSLPIGTPALMNPDGLQRNGN